MIDDAQVQWRKSSYSGGGAECVEIARTDAVAVVRDSKNPVGPVLRFEPRALGALLNGC